MLKKVFIDKINDVFILMTHNNLRKDIDDTLLEKLLNVIKAGDCNCFETADIATCNELKLEQNHYLIAELLQQTEVNLLFEKSLISLLDSDENISLFSKSFAIHLLGICLGDKSIFSDYTDGKLLATLTTICKSNITNYSPSVQDALLSTLICISKHFEGISYLIDKGLIDTVFESFLSASYHVRKTARSFFISLFTSWFSLKSSTENSSQDVINLTLKDVIEKLVHGLKVTPTQDSPTFNECCILTLKQTLEIEDMKQILSKDFCLAQHILNVLSLYDFKNETSYTLIELFIESFYSSSPESASILIEVLKFFFEKKQAKSLIYLMSLLARHYQSSSITFVECVNVILLPLSSISGYTLPMNNQLLFQITWNDYQEIIAVEMDEKNECVQLVRTSFSSLSKLTEFMDAETLALIASISSKILLSSNTSDGEHKFENHVSNNRKVQLSILELFSCFSVKTVYTRLSKDVKDLLLKTLLTALEKSTYDNSFISQILKLIKTILILNANMLIEPSEKLKQNLFTVIERKLLDTRWPVVDSALDVVDQLVTGKDNKVWEKIVCEFRIHVTVWDIAVVGKSEGYVRASALRVIVAICLNDFLWTAIQPLRQVNEVKVVKILCKLANNPDIFIQREAITSLSKWLKYIHAFLSAHDKGKVFYTLTTAVKTSLDWDTKLIALRTWQFFAEKEFNFESLEILHESLKNLCISGYSTSLISALADHDNTVQCEAAQIISGLRKLLSDNGNLKTSLTFRDDTSMSEGADQESTELPSSHLESNMSREEREAAMEEVLDMYMINRIQNVLRTDDEEEFLEIPDSPSQGDFFCNMDFSNSDSSNYETKTMCECSIQEFWECIWSDKIENVITNSTKSSDVYSNDPISLLDDIIAAKIVSTVGDTEKYQDADCY